MTSTPTLPSGVNAAAAARRPASSRAADRRRVLVVTLLVIVGIGAIAGAAVLEQTDVVAPAVALVAIVVAFKSRLATPTALLIGIVGLLMLLPLANYSLRLPISLPPVGALIVIAAIILTVVIVSENAFAWQRTPLGWTIVGFLGTQFISIVVNIESMRRDGLISNSLREGLLYVIFVFLLFFVTRQLMRTEAAARAVLYLMAGAGGVIGVMSVIERATQFNVFYTVGSVFPFRSSGVFESFSRDGVVRAAGPTMHPIELGVMMALLIPIALYLAGRAQTPGNATGRALLWGGCAVAMLAGVFASGSRTGIVMVGVTAIVACLLRPRLLPAIVGFAVGVGFLVFLLLPDIFLGTIGTLFDVNALIDSQNTSPGSTGSGRLTDVDGSLHRISEHLFFGTGLGSRIVVGPDRNAGILDDQFLSTAESTGLVGVLGVVLLVGATVGRLLTVALSADEKRHRSLAVALIASVFGYFLSLVFFDGFSFWQSLSAFVVLLAVSSWLIAESTPYYRLMRRGDETRLAAQLAKNPRFAAALDSSRVG